MGIAILASHIMPHFKAFTDNVDPSWPRSVAAIHAFFLSAERLDARPRGRA
jgi:hypothetical protein